MNVIPFPNLQRTQTSASAILDRLVELFSEAVDRDGKPVGIDRGRAIANTLALRIRTHRGAMGLEQER